MPSVMDMGILVDKTSRTKPWIVWGYGLVRFSRPLLAALLLGYGFKIRDEFIADCTWTYTGSLDDRYRHYLLSMSRNHKPS
jgi:hypothetical protein